MVNVLDKVQPKNKTQLKSLIEYAFNHNIYDLNFIDTSKITEMSNLFMNCEYDIDVSNWDVSNVTNTAGMFFYCKNLDCDLSNWDVSNVTNTAGMFYFCKNFDCDLSHWNVSNVKYMYLMFHNCKKFNSDMSNWNVTKAKFTLNMFDGCDKMTIPNWYKK